MDRLKKVLQNLTKRPKKLEKKQDPIIMQKRKPQNQTPGLDLGSSDTGYESSSSPSSSNGDSPPDHKRLRLSDDPAPEQSPPLTQGPASVTKEPLPSEPEPFQPDRPWLRSPKRQAETPDSPETSNKTALTYTVLEYKHVNLEPQHRSKFYHRHVTLSEILGCPGGYWDDHE